MTDESNVGAEPAQLPVAPSKVQEATIAELATLQAFVRDLRQEDWTVPSAVESWSIGNVVAHLNLALGLYNRVLDAVMSGGGSGAAWKAFGQITKRVAPMAAPAFNAINNVIPRAMSGTLAPEVIGGQFAASSRMYRQKVERLGPHDFTRPVHYMGGPWPLSTFLAATVNEIAVHGWDMASRLDPKAYLGEDARTILPWFYWGATDYMLHAPGGLMGTIGASLSDPQTDMWWTLGGAGSIKGVGQPSTVDVTISGESGTFVLVLAGRLKVQEALRTTSLRTEGSDLLAGKFLESWRIV